MPQLAWKHLIGQQRARDVLGSAFAAGSLGHAYLLCGERGAGTFQAALELATALLCTNAEAAPCYQCEGCRKVLAQSHPDLHVIFPVALSAEHKGSDGKIDDEGWDHLTSLVRARLAGPYALDAYETVPQIPVDWVREVMHSIVRGATAGTHLVAIIDGVDMMSKDSANAMLKTLEEPPAGTIMLLLSERPHAVLPTIVSRCQVLRMGSLSPENIRDGLRTLRPDAPADAREHAVHYAMGSLGQAISLVDEPDTAAAEAGGRFLRLCVAGDWLQLAPFVDELAARQNFDLCVHMLVHMAFCIRNGLLTEVSASRKYIFGDALVLPATGGVDTARAERMLASCQSSVFAVRSYGSVPLILVNLALELTEILHEQ